MYNLKSEKEKKLQKKLIPVNIIVCLLALVAAISMFLAPIVKVDVGKILRDDRMIEFVEEKINDALGEDLSEEQGDVNYKPVVTKLVTNILSKSKGSVSISAVSAFKVLTAGENKADKVLDELLFGKNALATRLIRSVVDGVSSMFSTNEGRSVLEEAILSTLTNHYIESVEDEEVVDAFNKNVKELTGIFKKLDNAENEEDCAEVAREFIDKLDEYVSAGTISEAEKQAFVDKVVNMYGETKANLDEGESVTFEAMICVTISENTDLSKVNLGELFDGLFTKEEQADVHIKPVDEETTDDGGEEKDEKPATTYEELLAKMGYDEETKEELKTKMTTTLNNELNKLVKENGVGDYLEYYQYVFFAMLPFIALWLILFLFAFVRLFVKNKRFSMWYVKLFCWIPALIWLLLVLVPTLAKKVSFVSDLWNGDNGKLIQAVFGGISSLTWISGLCYVLMWLVSIFWAFPIKRKIKKERKYPEVLDAEDTDTF